MNSFKNNDYIDLLEIAKSLWAYKFMLIALAVVVAVLAVVRVEFFTKDQYVATGMLYVSNKQEVEEDEKVSQQDINTAKSMSATYREILKTRAFLGEISEEIGGKYSWSKIKSMTSIYAVNNTELMEVSVVANSPHDAYLIADSIVKNAPEKLGSIFENGLIKIVDDVVVPSKPIGKGTAKQGVMGAILGLVLGMAIVVVVNLFDTKVHKAEDVAKRYSVSILGEIYQ